VKGQAAAEEADNLVAEMRGVEKQLKESGQS